MKQTQTHVWSLAGEEAVAYSLATGKAAAVTRENGEVVACSLARERRRYIYIALGPRLEREKTLKPLLSRSNRICIHANFHVGFVVIEIRLFNRKKKKKKKNMATL